MCPVCATTGIDAFLWTAKIIRIANNSENINHMDSNNQNVAVGNEKTDVSMTPLAGGAAELPTVMTIAPPTTIPKPMDQFDNFFAKPRHLETVEWDLAATRLYSVDSLWTFPAIAKYISQWTFARGTPVMRITATGSTTDAGAWMFGFCPLNETHDFGVSQIPTTFKSGSKHAIMDLHANPVVTFRGVWCGSTRYRCSSSPGEYGSFFLEPLTEVISPVTGSTVTLRVEFWFEDVEFDLPKAQADTDDNEMGVKPLPWAQGLGDRAINPPHAQGVTAFAEDDMDYDILWKRPTWSSQDVYSSGADLEAPISLQEVDAGPSSAAYVANAMNVIGGVMVLQFFCVKTPFHTGQLEVRYMEAGEGEGDQSVYKARWNIGERSTFDVRVPLRQLTNLAKNQKARVALYPVTPLKHPDTVQNNVRIITYMHFEELKGDTLVTSPFISAARRAQGYSLIPEDVVTIGIDSEQEVDGFHLSELLHSREYLMGTVPGNFRSEGRSILFSPGLFDYPHAINTGTGGAVALENFPDKMALFSGFFAYLDKAPEVKFSIGQLQYDMPFTNEDGTPAFTRQALSDFIGPVSLGAVPIGLNGAVSTLSTIGSVTINSEVIDTALMKTGDIETMHLPSWPNRWNLEKSREARAWYLSFVPVNYGQGNAPVLPAISMIRKSPKFYGMVSSGPIFP